jgi:hypothetical protein
MTTQEQVGLFQQQERVAVELPLVEEFGLGRPLETSHPQAALGKLREELATEQHDGGPQLPAVDPQVEAIERLGRSRHRGVETTRFDRTRVTDAGLVHLKGLTRLRTLWLEGTGVTDAGLAHLRGASELNNLRLQGTGITDDVLPLLRGMTNLNELRLQGTRVTDAGVHELRKALPGLQVVR